jgi:hypothetical protein
MEAGEHLPRRPEQEYPLESVLAFALQDQTPVFGGDQKHLQFKGESIRCYTHVPTGEVVTEHYEVDGRTRSFDREVKKPVLVTEYASLVDLYHGIEAERQEHDDATREEREEVHERPSEVFGPAPEQIGIEEPEELIDFKAKTVSEESIIEAANHIVEFREQSGIDEDAIICANCEGDGQLHHDTCGWCQGGSYEIRDMQGNITEKKDPDSPDPDCTACHGEGAHSSTCVCCEGEGTISKYPSLTLVNDHTGQAIELTFDIAKLLAEGAVSINRQVEEKAFDNGHIDHSTTTWITLSDWLAQQFTALGLDPQQSGINADGRFYESNRSLSFDLQASYDSWRRTADTPMMGIHAGEVRAFRKANQTVGMLSRGKHGEILTGEDIVISAQHQVADYVPQAFNQNGEKKQHQKLILFNLASLEDSFAELKGLVEQGGQTLGYSYSWYNGHSYNFYSMDEQDEIVNLLESNHQSFRSAVENAKLKLTA